MTRLTDWMDRHIDATGHEHLAHDADDAMHPLVAALLAVIVACVIVAAIGLTAAPAGTPELAPTAGTTVAP